MFRVHTYVFLDSLCRNLRHAFGIETKEIPEKVFMYLYYLVETRWSLTQREPTATILVNSWTLLKEHQFSRHLPMITQQLADE